MDRKLLEEVVRNNDGIAVRDVATLMGHDYRTVRRHAKRNRHIVVVVGARGRGNKTQLRWKYYYRR